MQQRLAVASVLLLGLLAGASVLMIQSHVYGQAQPVGNSQATSTTTTTATSSTSTSVSNSTTISTSTGGSLLTTATATSEGDD